MKPRESGITMVLDKNIGVGELNDLLSCSGQYIDIMKFGWGTSRVLPRDIITRKIELLKKHSVGVCPGGTLLELAFVQGKVDYFLSEAFDSGFDCIEVSDGTVVIPHDTKIDLIGRAKKKGFRVYSEIGKKFLFEEKRYNIEERIAHARRELDSGAEKIIIEARETGSFGIFNDSGDVIPELVDRFVAAIGSPNIIFEAPYPNQQQWLISKIGNSVNLGNVSPEDALNLETLRTGLRAGTLKEYHMGRTSVFIENGVSGALAASLRNDIIIVIDALRASTTIISALSEGVKSVKPVSSAEECVGELTAGERGGVKIPGLAFDNSPLVFARNRDLCAGKELVLTTTNGTECIKASSRNSSTVLIGSLVNAEAVARYSYDLSTKKNKNISIVMAGRNNLIAKEDLISASEIWANLNSCSLKGNIGPMFSEDIVADFMDSDSGRNLISQGKKDDVLFCARKNVFSIVPEMRDGVIVTGGA